MATIQPPGERDRSAWTDQLLPAVLADRLTTAGNDPSMTGELAVIRHLTAKVMIELDDDPAEQARLIAKLITSAAAVARTQRLISDQAADQWTDMITKTLLDLGEV